MVNDGVAGVDLALREAPAQGHELDHIFSPEMKLVPVELCLDFLRIKWRGNERI
jgi:hypothetical protein